jgi:dCMP deaminase
MISERMELERKERKERMGSERKERMGSERKERMGSERKERMGWDEYFSSIARLASQRSPCARLHVGSVIVRDNRMISMGYNGFIAGCPHASHMRDGHEQATIHSEINAISDCAKRGVSLDGAKIYITHYPCLHCFKTICASGIVEIIYLEDYNNDELVESIAKDTRVIIRKHC